MKKTYATCFHKPSIKNNRNIVKKDKINVSDIARKVLGIKAKTQPKDMPANVRRDFWCVTKMFGNVVRSYTCRHGYKTDGGRGMRLVQDYILQH